MFRFKPFGPFEVPVSGGRIEVSELGDFWKAIEENHPGLQNAVGCYIFTTKSRDVSRPWYVGKTERRSFKFEAFQPHKRELYQDALQHIDRATAEIYLIAKVTDTDKFRKPTKARAPSIARLEELLIGACLLKNPRLVNKSTTKHLREIVVPGFMGKTLGAKTYEAKMLSKLLKTKTPKNRLGKREQIGDQTGNSIAGKGLGLLANALMQIEDGLSENFNKLGQVSIVFNWEEKDYAISINQYVDE